ncbi:DUF5047 domain-containing protein [Streptomyces sp. B1I3]|uniref:DUF5047 domain-containing protein n=1 Tax=Streptomyces sp. B1I3 TaxID=3042264 RepID=UPI00278A2945|nr:DUF5047 domain-containing protein [Streptomyces sp. B1I3]MDQ0791956.1 hypothetical protein [Streptomyces sp. B1I3]
MYPPPSDRFLATLATAHVPYTEVRMTASDGTVTVLPHTGGSVTVSRGQAVRRTCSVTVPDTSLIPIRPTGQMAIYGARLRILRGIAYPDGSVESVPLGEFRIDEVGGDPDYGPVTITGSSIEAAIADDAFLVPYTTRGGPGAVTAITDLIRSSMPTAVVTSRVADALLGPTTWDAQGDRWAAVQACATAIGAEVYADADGQFVIAELPDIAAAPIAWTVDAGEQGVLIAATRGYNRAGMYNVVVASGENTETNVAAVSSTVQDTDPTSPTYVGGPFGRVPRFYSSSLLISTDQCTAAATKLLRDSVKPAATVTLESAPNPCLEPGDVLRVTYANGDRELHQVQGLTLDLGLGSMQIDTIGGREDA